MDILAGISQE